MIKFSVIIPHYQGTVKHDRFVRGVISVLNQTFKGYEILCYHDGPLVDEDLRNEFPVPVKCTNKRYNDWGHSLRDIGIKQARGEYIIHFNPDNLLYPNALEEIAKREEKIIVYPIKMMGLEIATSPMGERYIYYSTPRDYTKWIILFGYPVEYGNVDCMQFVMRKDLWIQEGGWKDKREQADGFMYPGFARKYKVKAIKGEPLGEHW